MPIFVQTGENLGLKERKDILNTYFDKMICKTLVSFISNFIWYALPYLKF